MTDSTLEREPERLPEPIVAWQPTGRGARGVTQAAMLIGAVAVGALAVGALAIGTLAIGRLAVGRVRLGRVMIDELIVRRASGL